MEPKEVLETWSRYFNDVKIKSIVDLYEKGSNLIPTYSNQIFSNSEKIKEYFQKILIEKKVKVQIIFDSVSQKKIGENIFLMSGNYIFKFSEKKKSKARFSFLISPLSENPIKHHHSSLMPEE